MLHFSICSQRNLPVLPKIENPHPPMANIVFIAVQCCQCSTMQVKQQKKSSNKWNCAVCNEKQSVRKVFARGFMAKDIRKFVQSFNMSRCFAEQLTDDSQARFSEIDGKSVGIPNEENEKKRRVDWNEYLDEDDVHGDEVGARLEGVHDTGAELGPRIVTEWPDEFSKKPKLKKSRDVSHGQCEAAYKPIFSKKSRDFVSQGKDLRNLCNKSKETFPVGSIHEIDNPLQDPMQSNKMQPAKSTPAPKFGTSKWNQYIEKDGNQSLSERNHDSRAEDLDCRYEYDDLEVEDDVHPDFL